MRRRQIAGELQRLRPGAGGRLDHLPADPRHCDLHAEHAAGDHVIVIGRVSRMSPAEWHTRDPLLKFRRGYRRLLPMEEPA